MKIKENYSFFSNIIFLLPLFFSIKRGYVGFSFVIFGVFILSSLFHYYKPKGPIWFDKIRRLKLFQLEFFWADIFVANILIVYNFFVFAEKGFSNEFWYSMILAVVALYFYFFMTTRREYDICHAIWHIFAGIITLLAVIA